MLLTLPYFIFCANDMPKYHGINERYYSIIPEEDVTPRCNSTRAEYALKLAGQTEKERKQQLELTVPLTETQMKAQVCDALQDWLYSLHIVSFQSGKLSPEVRQGIQASQRWLDKIFAFCQAEELDPVVVVPPLSQTLLVEIGQAFRDSHFYGPLREVIGDRSIPVLDYTREPRFCDPSLYGWPGFLVKSAAKEFTKDVLKRLGIISKNILPDDACTGCGACENACRRGAVSLRPDGRGFARPRLDREKCVDCGQCVQACPVCTPPEGVPLSEVYALRSRDEELRFRSTSGGAFSELALTVLRRGGCVVGEAYREDWSVGHRMIEREEELEPLRRSKYQQSDTGLVFRQVKEKLAEGREVLFCGTPCQAAGLRSFLGRDEDKLYLCDFICRGATSPKLFQAYLRELEERYQSKAVSVWQKNKRKGWRSLSTVVSFADGREYECAGAQDPYTRMLIHDDIGVRSSCYICAFKGDRSPADITLGDFWGLEDPALDDNMGTSVVICRTEKGRALFAEASGRCIVTERTAAEVARGNPCLLSPLLQRSVSNQSFFEQLDREGFQAAYESLCAPSPAGGGAHHVVLFGCGQAAKEFYFRHKSQVTIDYALSNNPAEHIFSPEIGTGYEVRRPTAKRGKGPLIVICTAAYKEIAEQLTLLGYTPFEDFVDCQMMELSLGGKKTALLYGICHLRGVGDCLRRSADFMAQYEPFYYASYLPHSAYQQMRLGWLAERCELFLYSLTVMPQEAQKNAALLSRLKEGAKRFCLPVAYFGGYFPQRERAWNDMNRYAVQCAGHDYTPFSYGDCWLNQCIDRGMTVDKVLESLRGETAYDRDFVSRYLDREWRQLELQERQSNFKILDYVKENFQKRRLFHNEAHMENEVLEYYARQFLQKLGLSDDLSHIAEPLMRCSRHPIYPGVAKALGLEWDVERELLELYTYAGWRTVTPREYVEYYLETCKKTKELKEKHMFP